MTKPMHLENGARFDLATAGRELRGEPAYLRDGHTARTLARETDLRIVLVVLKASARMAEHQANESASVHILTGHVRFHLPSQAVDLSPGWLFVLEKGLRHEVEAIEESALLLTLGWKDG